MPTKKPNNEKEVKAKAKAKSSTNKPAPKAKAKAKTPAKKDEVAVSLKFVGKKAYVSIQHEEAIEKSFKTDAEKQEIIQKVSDTNAKFNKVTKKALENFLKPVTLENNMKKIAKKKEVDEEKKIVEEGPVNKKKLIEDLDKEDLSAEGVEQLQKTLSKYKKVEQTAPKAAAAPEQRRRPGEH